MRKERPEDAFGFSEREQLWDRVSHNHFMQLVGDEATRIHRIELSSNTYGEFLFVTLSRKVGEGPVALTFYGAGYHEQRERWVTDTWAWYETALYGDTAQQTIERDEAIQQINERYAEIASHASENTQTGRGKLFEMLADMTDEDGALAEMDDLGDMADFFDADDLP